MMHRAAFLAGAAVGYVVGTRAGRERYESIKRAAGRVMGSPQVQHTASTLGHQATGLAAHAGRAVTERVGERVPFVGHRAGQDAYPAPNGHGANS
ncbi:MAG: YtxH domain-containing protein [Actinomycetes bacterium]